MVLDRCQLVARCIWLPPVAKYRQWTYPPGLFVPLFFGGLSPGALVLGVQFIPAEFEKSPFCKVKDMLKWLQARCKSRCSWVWGDIKPGGIGLVSISGALYLAAPGKVIILNYQGDELHRWF